MSPKVLHLAAAAALLLVIGGGIARAQSIEGGCTATINGQPPTSLTADNAFEIEKDQVVSITGTVPGDVGNQEEIESTTELTIFAGDVFGGVPFETIEGTGPEWGGDAEVPDALFDYAPGIYLVGGNASGTGGWSCEGTGYIDIKGGPWTAALAAGGLFAVVGLFMLKSSRGPRRSASDAKVQRAAEGKGLGSTSDFQDAMDQHMDHDAAPDAGPGAERGDRGTVDASKDSGGTDTVKDSMAETPDAPPAEQQGSASAESSRGSRGQSGKKGGGGRGALQNAMNNNGATHRMDALAAVVAAVPVALALTNAMGSSSTLVSGLVFASMPAASATTFWVRGRTVLGFFGGLLTGLGIAIALHQFDVWGASAETLIYVPVAFALIGAIRGWRGRAYSAG